MQGLALPLLLLPLLLQWNLQIVDKLGPLSINIPLLGVCKLNLIAGNIDGVGATHSVLT